MDYIWLIIAHFIADFLFQTREMGVNKSHSLKWLLAHVFVYTSVLTLCSFGAWYLYEINVSYLTVLQFCMVNSLLHLATDFTTSKVNSYFYKNDKIGFDQMIHAICLLYTFDKLLLI